MRNCALCHTPLPLLGGDSPADLELHAATANDAANAEARRVACSVSRGAGTGVELGGWSVVLGVGELCGVRYVWNSD